MITNNRKRTNLGRAVRGRKQWNRNKYRRNRYSRTLNVPMISNKPITMGVGTTSIYIGQNVTTTQTSTVNKYELADVIANSPEYILKRNSFSYMKINYIKIIINQAGTNSNSVAYFLINWVNDNDMTADQILNSDNSKAVPAYRPRLKVLTFIPPNAEVNGRNPSLFQTSQATPYMGTLYMSANFSLPFRIEIHMIFRGSRDFNIGSAINDMKLLQVRKEVKEKNEEKKEEKKEKRNKSKKQDKKEKEEKKDVEKYATSSVDEDEL